MHPPAVALPARRSLVGWAALALVLVVGFYLLTLLLAAVCVYLPFEVIMLGGGSLQAVLLLLSGMVIAGTMLWSLVPRRDTFEVPGPRLQASGHPRLFAEIEGLAIALNEPLPQDVYLIPEVNAWVAQRGGLMGFGSRRVMGLGLSLLQILTIPQFRAVLAHEFGHYYGGDTRLGPWVYKTRAAMVRTLLSLGQRPAVIKPLMSFAAARSAYYLVTRALVAYWNLFLRTTQLVSRHQEYRADELACYVAGSNNLIEGLERIHRASAAVPAYWDEITYILSAGYRPPIAEGFALFIAANNIRQVLAAQLEKELAEPHTTLFDSHPPLRDRLAAARHLAQGVWAEGDPPAISLVEDVYSLEGQMLQVLNPNANVSGLKETQWERIGADVYASGWKRFVDEYKPLLSGLTIGSLPDAVKGVQGMGSHILDPKGMLLTREQRADRAADLLVSAFALALLANGWELPVQPGQLYFKRGLDQLRPFQIVAELRKGVLAGDAWLERSTSLGIQGLRLDAV